MINKKQHKLGKALLELTNQNIFSMILMSILFPITARRLARLAAKAKESFDAGDFGADEDYNL